MSILAQYSNNFMTSFWSQLANINAVIQSLSCSSILAQYFNKISTISRCSCERPMANAVSQSFFFIFTSAQYSNNISTTSFSPNQQAIISAVLHISSCIFISDLEIFFISHHLHAAESNIYRSSFFIIKNGRL
jgi:hypothetical protein